MIPWVYINFMIPVMHGRAIYERLCQFAHCAVKKGMCKTVQMILCYIIGVCMSSCCREEKSVWWSYWVPGGPSWERFPARGKISGRDSPQDWQGMVIQLYIHFIFIIFGKSNASYIYMSEYSFKNGTMHTCILMKCLIWQWFKPFSPDGWSSGAGPRSFLKDRGHGC